MWLLMVGNGVIVASYEEIADQLGSNKFTVKGWVDLLVTTGVAERQPKGKRVEIKLTGEYLRVAASTDEIRIEGPSVGQIPPQVQSLIKLSEGANELGGQISITVNGCHLGAKDV